MFCGQEVGSAGRYEVGVVDCDVRMMLQENSLVRRLREVLRSVEAVERVAVVDVDVDVDIKADVELRIDHVNASISSRMMECMRRCVLLCRVLSNK
jgi:hypothetical protein